MLSTTGICAASSDCGGIPPDMAFRSVEALKAALADAIQRKEQKPVSDSVPPAGQTASDSVPPAGQTRRLYKDTDFPLPLYHHAKYAGHNASHGNYRLLPLQISLYGIAVLSLTV